MNDALIDYLRALSFGCDLGTGNDTMTMVGLGSALAGLKGIEWVIMRTDDSRLLAEVTTRLEAYSNCLPTAESALTREQLWLENAAALDKLQHESEWGRHPIDDWRAAWRLWQITPITTSLAALSSIGDYHGAMDAAGAIAYRTRRSSNSVVKTIDIAGDSL